MDLTALVDEVVKLSIFVMISNPARHCFAGLGAARPNDGR